MKSFIAFLFILTIPLVGMAQHTKTVRNNGQWIHNYAQFRVSERINVVADAGFRTRSWFQNVNMYIVRAGVTYNVHPSWKLGVGFAHSGTFIDNALYKMEYRPHQELISQHEFSGVEITNRLRIEEQIQRVLFNDSLVPFVARVRLKFQAAAPVLGLSKNHPERQLYIVLGNEFILNAGNTVKKYNVLNQNRMTVGPSFRVTEYLDITLLYMYLFGTTVKQNVLTQDHVMWLSFNYKVDFRKNKGKAASIRNLGE